MRPGHQGSWEIRDRQAAEVFQSSIISWSSKIIDDGTVESSHRTRGSRQDSKYSRVYSSKSATWSSGDWFSFRPFLQAVAAAVQPGPRLRRELVGIHLVAEEHEGVGPLVLGQSGDPAGVEVERVRRDPLGLLDRARAGVAAGTEGQPERPLTAGRPDPAGWELRVPRRPHLDVFQPHLVRRRAARLEVLDHDQRVVVAVDAEGARTAAQHVDVAGAVGLDPYRRRDGVDVPQQRPQQEDRFSGRQ